VLLVEAGGRNDDTAYLVRADRYKVKSLSEAGLNWGNKTTPQTQLKGQEIDYSRGKGLGGSSAINFQCSVIGPKEDFGEWALKVGDDAWR
jgi:choline dehydrogenase-like flavoprotein